jgi:hypothetical protein
LFQLCDRLVGNRFPRLNPSVLAIAQRGRVISRPTPSHRRLAP